MWTQAIFKQNYTLELFISLKMAISCCFGLRGNLEFPDFLQKKFYNINYSLNFHPICFCMGIGPPCFRFWSTDFYDFTRPDLWDQTIL